VIRPKFSVATLGRLVQKSAKLWVVPTIQAFEELARRGELISDGLVYGPILVQLGVMFRSRNVL
jgi:hypothetical protein